MPVSRRDLMKWTAAWGAVAALPGCDPPKEALPYVTLPEGTIPGRPRYYASAWVFAGYAQPVVGTVHVGRPTKLEGNPDHPAGRGATDPFTQMAVLGLYDPDRSATIRRGRDIAPWNGFLSAIWSVPPRRVAVLTGAVTSPTAIRQLDSLPGPWFSSEPVGDDNAQGGARLAFGRDFEAVPRLDRAQAVICIGADPLGPGPHQTWNALNWSEARRRYHQGGARPLLLAAEAVPTLTGARADFRLAVKPARQVALLAALTGQEVELTEDERQWLVQARAALDRAGNNSLILAGRHLPPMAHAKVLALTHRLGGFGRTIIPTAPITARRPGLADFIAAVSAGEVDAAVVLDANPVHTSLADQDVAAALARLPLTVHAGCYADETAAACDWHLPLAHPLEEWSDARAVNGMATIIQPLVRPLFGIARHRILGALAHQADPDPLAMVKSSWAGLGEDGWTRALEKGLVKGSEPPPLTLDRPSPLPPMEIPAEPPFQVVLQPDAKVWDGRFANLAWAQEMGDPITKVTWDHAATLAPDTARRMGIENGDAVTVETGDGMALVLPACILPGQAEDCAGLTLGGGRTRAGRLGSGVGIDLKPLRTGFTPWSATARLARGGDGEGLAQLQIPWEQGYHDVAKQVGAPDARPSAKPEPETSLYEEWSYPDHSWAMSIDLDLCIGCNTCMIACQAENNIPPVGRHEVALGRAMHWIRIDRYHTPDTIQFQPVPCMHCDKAPCEVGCPVNATVHTSEGINAQVYNRCIGTRTCSAYCPYEVRRFNFYDYNQSTDPAVAALHNPDVTVRSRGVMEKCTYCIQRIEAARIKAQVAGVPLDGDTVQTACQQACPTRAIAFGDLNAPGGRMERLKAAPRSYAMLAELNTRPRTTYLARIRPAKESE